MGPIVKVPRYARGDRPRAANEHQKCRVALMANGFGRRARPRIRSIAGKLLNPTVFHPKVMLGSWTSEKSFPVLGKSLRRSSLSLLSFPSLFPLFSFSLSLLSFLSSPSLFPLFPFSLPGGFPRKIYGNQNFSYPNKPQLSTEYCLTGS